MATREKQGRGGRGRPSSSPRIEQRWSFPTATSLPSAVKRMISYQIQRELARQGLSQAHLAQQMRTSRAAVNRLLDPENRSVTLQTLERTAQILSKRLQVYLKD